MPFTDGWTAAARSTLCARKPVRRPLRSSALRWSVATWAVGLAILTIGTTGCGGPIWYLDPGFGVRHAEEKQRPLLLYFKAWDSAQHRNMRIQVLDKPAVRAELLDTVNVEIPWGFFDIDRQYHVETPQVCIMCTPDGREVGRMFVNPVPEQGAFIDWLRDVKVKAAPPPASGPASSTSSAATRPSG